MVTLHMPLPIWQQLRCYVETSLPNEVTGAGVAEMVDPENAQVIELYLPKQHVSSGYSEFGNGELGRITCKFFASYPPAAAGDLCFRWHSHGYGQVFWSSIDEADIDRWKGDYAFNLVTNAHGDTLTRLDYFRPYRAKNIPVRFAIDYPPLDPGLMKQYQAEIKASLTQIVYPKDEHGVRSKTSSKGGDKLDTRLFGPNEIF